MAEISRLPAPVVEEWDWQRFGACRGTESAVFFHPDNERGMARRRRDEAAKKVCAICPVIIRCREHALAVEEPYGVWGGQDEDERRAEVLARKGRSRTKRRHHAA
ncbi:WhiB family transcriptional regulator [Allokutzneria albata]|uniref:Transcriptional regulator WhiB n=1 Tax=Allokutzneria albata TaxID=211114 RepID=A0A1G9URX1_ALLAB|nr:WhiB family transcriptional regulator [Allokutzneria albata]SDM62659.1 WhiB family transcriptional regulator, redox-sensing transcriptional regulator [Allokutzneria albata]